VDRAPAGRGGGAILVQVGVEDACLVHACSSSGVQDDHDVGRGSTLVLEAAGMDEQS
jgi:hypothetical protein